MAGSARSFWVRRGAVDRTRARDSAVNVCTISTIPLRDGVRLVCNRDERRARPAALETWCGMLGPRLAVFPVDPVSGGTWIGINDACLAFALLNRTLERHSPGVGRQWQSRGTIIPPMLARDRLHAAVEQAMTIEARDFEPFRLLILQGRSLAAVVSDGCRLSCAFMNANRPLLFTSSALGDRLVEIPRHDLFDRLVVNAPGGWRAGQSRFHHHQWRRRPEISVVMNRSDARTVSRTVIDATLHQMKVRYQPLEDPFLCFRDSVGKPLAPPPCFRGCVASVAVARAV